LLYKAKPFVRFAHNGLFISNPLQEQVLDGPENKKPCAFAQGFVL
jgi:hypothetical protein